LETAVRRAFQGIGQAETSDLLLTASHFYQLVYNLLFPLFIFFDVDQYKFLKIQC